MFLSLKTQNIRSRLQLLTSGTDTFELMNLRFHELQYSPMLLITNWAVGYFSVMYVIIREAFELSAFVNMAE